METESRQEKLEKLRKFWKIASGQMGRIRTAPERILPATQSDLPSFRILESPV
ncbi:MAG: hypothetical protein U5K27_07530 [Desulfotignum sp.]|nr:hypothetical protein [Desulfotignum sp.]